jgi:hypothetical protein
MCLWQEVIDCVRLFYALSRIAASFTYLSTLFSFPLFRHLFFCPVLIKTLSLSLGNTVTHPPI